MVVPLVLGLLMGQSHGSIPTGRVCILEPSIDPTVFTSEGPRLDPYAAAARVHKRLAGESRRWAGWKVEFVDFSKTLKAQRALFGARGQTDELGDRLKLKSLASRVGARYVIHYHLSEYTGARTGGPSPRTTGKTTIDVLVFDSIERKNLWHDKVTDTSTVFGTKSPMQNRMDQSYLNALRRSLEPFFVKGYLKRLSVP